MVKKDKKDAFNQPPFKINYIPKGGLKPEDFAPSPVKIHYKPKGGLQVKDFVPPTVKIHCKPKGWLHTAPSPTTICHKTVRKAREKKTL